MTNFWTSSKQLCKRWFFIWASDRLLAWCVKKQSIVRENGDVQKMVFIGRNLCHTQCYIVLEEINKLYSEEVLNHIFMPVSCDTFYAGKLFLKVITVFFSLDHWISFENDCNGDKCEANVSFWLWYMLCWIASYIHLFAAWSCAFLLQWLLKKKIENK